MRHTKIVATVGPASSTPDGLRALMAAGVDVFRLNFSHGSHHTHAAVYRLIRECARDVDRHVAVLQDLSGPKIRTGPLSGDALQLVEGAEIRIGAGEAPSRPGHIFTSYAPLVRSAQPGDRLLLDDGRIELRVTAAKDDALQAVVVNGGVLGAHKGINAPGIALAASAVTDKDADDLCFGLQLGVDLVALSFVQTADDIRRACTIMNEVGRLVPVIAKIERPAAVENLDGILQVAEGVMVARGDLGLEMPLEQLPRIQRTILARARSAGRPVILATQVLESMRSEPRPTRAEVSDAANAESIPTDSRVLPVVDPCLQFGPPFLHSTGQACRRTEHWRVPPDHVRRRSRPGRAGPEIHIRRGEDGASARGFRVLLNRDRRALRAHLGPDVAAHLGTLEAAFVAALQSSATSTLERASLGRG